jgi:EAL domain-containing protein (putative c-di-GMP-specific phosphodiesterase class I)
VPPPRFIPITEETGLIVPIGDWALRTAAAECAALRRELQDNSLRIAVNLSARQFADDAILRLISGMVSASGLGPDGLALEITESVLIHNPEQAARLLLQLKEMGVQLALDDFGTGYSSLAYLKRFPVDAIKIDRSFVEGLPADGDDATIARAIIAMAHSLRLTVVAEGVETAEQFEFLRELCCEEIQGYHLSQPLPASDLRRFLAAQREQQARRPRQASGLGVAVWP